MEICFRIHFVASVSLKLSSCTQFDSMSNLAKFLKNVCSLCIQFQKNPVCQIELLGFDICSSDRHFSPVHCMWLILAQN